MADWRRAASLVARLLNGETPVAPPVEPLMTCELVINLKMAQASGLTIPLSLLFQADSVSSSTRQPTPFCCTKG